MCGPQRRQGGHVLLLTGSDVYCNGEKGNKAATVRDCNFRDACEASFSAQVRRESRGKCKKRGMKCSRSNFWAITRLKTLADEGWDGIACVASVSNRFIARKLERKQKKGFAPSPVIHFFFLLLSQFSR